MISWGESRGVGRPDHFDMNTQEEATTLTDEQTGAAEELQEQTAATPAAEAPKKEEKKPKVERSIDDEGDDIVVAAAVGDTIANVFGDDDDDEAMNFILGLAAAGIIFAGLGIYSNSGNVGVMVGAIIYLIGYAVLMLRIMPIILVGLGLGGFYFILTEDTNLPFYVPLACLGIGGLGFLIRYLIPKHIMRIMQKASWVVMFGGPIVMCASGATITGSLCMVVAGLWLLLFLFRAVIVGIINMVFNFLFGWLLGPREIPGKKQKTTVPVSAVKPNPAVKRKTSAKPEAVVKPKAPDTTAPNKPEEPTKPEYPAAVEALKQSQPKVPVKENKVPENTAPKQRTIIKTTMPVPGASTINGIWYPKLGEQRMSLARYKLRCHEFRKEQWAWHKEHWLTWSLPLMLNVLGGLMLLAMSITTIIIAIICFFVAEILMLVYSIRILMFIHNGRFRNDSKMRMKDLGLPPISSWVPAIIMFFAALLFEESWIVLAVFLAILLPYILLYYLPGQTDANKYGPVPDDEPTPDEWKAVKKSPRARSARGETIQATPITWKNALSCSGQYTSGQFWMHWGATALVSFAILCIWQGSYFKYINSFISFCSIVSFWWTLHMLLVLPAFVKRLRGVGRSVILPYIWLGTGLVVMLTGAIVNPTISSISTHETIFWCTQIPLMLLGLACYILCFLPARDAGEQADQALFGRATKWYAGMALARLLMIPLLPLIAQFSLLYLADMDILYNRFEQSVSEGDVEMAEKILDTGRINPALLNGDVDHLQQEDWRPWNMPQKDKTPLRLAIEKNNQPLFDYLLNHPDVDVNAQAPIHLALQLDRTQMVQQLIHHPKFDICTRDENNETLLEKSISSNNRDLLQQLMQHPAFNINTSCVLHTACRKGLIDMVQLLLDTPGIDINYAEQEHGNTPMHEAAICGHADIVELLLKQEGININRTNHAGKTPRQAVPGWSSNQRCARLLECAMYHPLQKAAYLNDLATLHSLLQAGEDVNATDDHGNTALHIAVKERNQDVITRLLQVTGLDANKANNDGNTALHIAAFNGAEAHVRLLLDVPDIKLATQNNKGQTPAQYARAYFNMSCAKLIEEAEQARRPKQPAIPEQFLQALYNTEEPTPPAPQPNHHHFNPQPVVEPRDNTADIVRKRIRLSEPYTGLAADALLEQDIANTCTATINILPKNIRMSRAELAKNLKAFGKRWPERTYNVLGVARSGNVIEIQVFYQCFGRGKSTSGYSLFTLILDDENKIRAMGEKTAKTAPPPFSPGMQKVHY